MKNYGDYPPYQRYLDLICEKDLGPRGGRIQFRFVDAVHEDVVFGVVAEDKAQTIEVVFLLLALDYHG